VQAGFLHRLSVQIVSAITEPEVAIEVTTGNVLMFVCICHGVTDNAIHNSVDEGSTTMRCLSRGLNVGTECGQCVKAVKQVLNLKLVSISFDDDDDDD
jgi:bacterioferritin-associated ferredoxin